MAETGKGFYRPELDVIRFLAFFCVFLHHTVPRFTGAHGRAYDSVVDALGFGLCLFFTLSAYLITLLLLKEKRYTGAIHLRAFYIRRILRIWPLYLLGLAMNLGATYLVGPWHGDVVAKDVLLCLVMLGNLAPFTVAHLTIGHLWSISLEEQFYVFWPSTMRWLPTRFLAWGPVFLILLANLVQFRLGWIHAEPDLRVWTNSFVQFECFAAGILLALYDTRRPELPSLVSALLTGIAGLLWFTAAFQFKIKGHPPTPPGPLDFIAGYALVCIACILILVAVPVFRRSPKPLVYLGKISFGLYVFHGPVMRLCDHYLKKHVAHGLTPIILAMTIGLAMLSYEYFEKPFLRLKRRHELVKTRPV